MSRKSNRALWTAKLKGETDANGNVRAGGGKKRRETANAAIDKWVAPQAFRGVVLGIDPSLRGTGLALLRVERGEAQLLFSRTVRVKTEVSLAVCLGRIFSAVAEALTRAEVVHVALEQIIFVQNRRIVAGMGAARGAAIVAAALRELPVFEYAPLRIKQAVVGFGRASKEQVARTMAQHLRLAEALPSDEADAAATALCHALTWRG
jgi:crossover junction endodeoxyribonuclease RuvC